MVEDAKDLHPAIYRRLVGIRYRRRLGEQEPPVTDESRRRALETAIANVEKIDLTSDFLPIRYLADGVAQARAVCRISGPMGMGTGFLVSRGVIMTNNHVLENESQAQDSIAEFNYEDGQTPVVVKLQPRRLFLTDIDLDFTVVACDDTPIVDIAPIKLLRDPATITRNELASIIQHPAGRRKEIALHNNEVTRVKDKVIHYRTDTEPGSSGSPVFNNRWQLVALHHAGWIEPDGRATNEGIRIAAIVEKLRLIGFAGIAARELLEGLLEGIKDTSPYLGFFDLQGLGVDRREVVVNGFTGSPDFADIGFWNIEHFNGDVSEQRIARVSEVVARLTMDVLGLIEVEKEALDRLVLELGRQGLSYDYEVVDGSGRQDLAILFDEDTTKAKLRPDLLRRYSNKFSQTTRDGKSAFPRLPLIAECEILEKQGTEPLRFLFMVVHLKAFGDAVSQARRRLASEILSEVIGDLRTTEDLPIILGGDFNDTLTSGNLDALRDSPDLFTMTADDTTDPDAITYVGRSHRSLIDHIITSRDVVPGDIQGDDVAIVRLDNSISDFTQAVSDHVPIVFRMVYRDQELELSDSVEAELSEPNNKAVHPQPRNGKTMRSRLTYASLGVEE
ncbi:MAG: trypsin-like peptidase domain-containing protein [Tatlockia sp.]|nr:trypsin-like peptidase domain-containing protein [Tatlockia sp.]